MKDFSSTGENRTLFSRRLRKAAPQVPGKKGQTSETHFVLPVRGRRAAALLRQISIRLQESNWSARTEEGSSTVTQFRFTAI